MLSITLKHSRYCKGEKAVVHFERYTSNGRVAIQLMSPDGEPIGRPTVNIPEEPLADGEIILKGWEENEGLTDDLIAYGIVGPVKRWVNLGFVEASVHDLLLNNIVKEAV